MIFILLMYVQIKLLFTAELQLCDQIWSRLDPYREKAFADVTDSSVHMLLSFGEAIARSKKTPEKLFVLLDMYEIMRDLQSEVIISLLYQREADTHYFFAVCCDLQTCYRVSQFNSKLTENW